MRKTVLILIVVLSTFQAHASVASTVSGIAVAAHWLGATGGNGYEPQYFKWWSTPTDTSCRIMKYVITNGITTNTSVLYNGAAKFATLSSDGKYVAFVRHDDAYAQTADSAAIAYVSASGGTPVNLVAKLAGSSAIQLEWPIGDWLWYGKCIPQPGDAASAPGMSEIWKVNTKTNANIKVDQVARGTNTNGCYLWDFSMSLDATKMCVYGVDNGSSMGTNMVYRFPLSDFPNDTMTFLPNDVHELGGACGTAMAPDAAYTMSIESIDHISIRFHRWDKTLDTILYVRNFNSWTTNHFVDTTGARIGGMWQNHWSANDAKWICIQCGFDCGRDLSSGSNQVLVNWIDHQIIRTSRDTANHLALPGTLGQWWLAAQNETGDFWEAGLTPVVPPVVRQAPVPDGRGMLKKVFDLRGREIGNGRSLKLLKGVYIVETCGNNAAVTRKLSFTR